MPKRIAAMLLALCMLFSVSLSCAEDWEDDDDWGDEDFGDEEPSSFEEEEDAGSFLTMGGYHMPVEQYGDFGFMRTADNQAAILTSYSGCESHVILPETVTDGLPAIAINTAMCVCNEVIETLEIPGSIQSIGVNAFANCANLRSVVIRDGLTTLQVCCFGGCLALKDIQLPDSLETVEDFAFANCPKLKEITFGSSLKSIGRQAFLKCGSLLTVTIPGGNSVRIGESAFDECPDELQIIY